MYPEARHLKMGTNNRSVMKPSLPPVSPPREFRATLFLTVALAGLLPAARSAELEPAWLPDVESPQALEQNFRNPPPAWRTDTFWVWPNTMNREAVTRELEAMAASGLSRVVISPHRAQSAAVKTCGMQFLSPEHLGLIRHTLDEAKRLGLTVELMLGNGWYPGGPWVTPDLAARMLVWSEMELPGGKPFSGSLPVPGQCHGFGKTVKGLAGKNVFTELDPRCLEHLQPVAAAAYQRNEEGHLLMDTFTRLDASVSPEGLLTWTPPSGNWTVFRYGHVPSLFPIKNPWPGYEGLQIDHLGGRGVERLFAEIAAPILEAAGPHAGTTLASFHDESVELGYFDWTEGFAGEFEKRRGYDLVRWLPVLAGKSFRGAGQCTRVEEDFQQTIDDLMADHYYGTFRRLCREKGMRLAAEGGTADDPSIQAKAASDLPMGEFWMSLEDDVPRLLRRETQFSANIRGQRTAAAEAFTTAAHWQESPADLKEYADRAFALGINRLVLHGFSAAPRGTSVLPTGDIYFAGTHFNPQLPWWDWADDLFAYFNRCQAVLQAGWPVADILYIEGPWTRNRRTLDDADHSRARHDWNAAPAPDIAKKLHLNPDGSVAFHDGMAYRVMAITDEAVDPDVLGKFRDLVAEGATLWLKTPPKRAIGWQQPVAADRRVRELTAEFTGGKTSGNHSLGKGRIFLGGEDPSAVFAALGMAPDFAYTSDDPGTLLRYAHRRSRGWDAWFIANSANRSVAADVTLRITGRRPEHWCPIDGSTAPLAEFNMANGTTTLPLRLAPRGSALLVFREPFHGTSGPGEQKSAAVQTLPVNGPWTVEFRPAVETEKAFTLEMPQPVRWENHPQLRHFAGSAFYRTTLKLTEEMLAKGNHRTLDLGTAHLAAEVTVNGRCCGQLWTAPWTADVSSALKAGKNEIEIRVANTWHNWRKAHPDVFHQPCLSPRPPTAPLLPSGLDGPVVLEIDNQSP
jgi:hypothetical protein